MFELTDTFNVNVQQNLFDPERVDIEVWAYGEYLIQGHVKIGPDLHKIQRFLYATQHNWAKWGFDNYSVHPTISDRLAYQIWFYKFPPEEGE